MQAPDLKKSPFFLTDEQCRWVFDTLRTLSPKQKLGQLFCVMGQDYSAQQLCEMVSRYCVGGVLFRPEPAAVIRERFDALDRAAPVPLLKAANLEEGGSGAISDGTFFGWPMLTAATDDLSVMKRFAEVCAVEGASAGVNWTFSPVCDLDLNFRNPITNVRTCGSDPTRVQRMCKTYVETVQRCGMAACAKHFPGDGVDFRDQHLHPTYNSLPADEWYQSYGKIYQTLIDAGLLSVMAGHIVQPNVERELNPRLSFSDCLPASLSSELLTGVLRNRFGFNGLITTDATIMGGFTEAMQRRKAIPAAVMAGCDMLVFSTDFYEDFGYLTDALLSGALTRERLDEAVTRILALKAKVARKPAAGIPVVDAAAWRKEAADKAITLVKDVNHVLPVSPKRYQRIRLITLGNDTIDGGSMTQLTESLLQAAGFLTERFDIEKEELHGTAALDPKRLTLYLANLETASNQTAVRIFWAKKHALDAPRHVCEEDSIFVSFANPYHLQDVPRSKTYLNAYSCHEDTVRAVIEKLLGRSPLMGTSPVDAFCGLPDTRL